MEGERAWAALPLTINHDPIGVLGLIFPSARRFDSEERTFLTTVANLCAQAIERARLMASERDALSAADEALSLLNTVIDSAPLGMAFVDTEFRYRRVNASMAQLNGRTQAEHLGRRASELFPSLSLLWEYYWRRVLETGEPITNLELSANTYQSAIGTLGHSDTTEDIGAIAGQHALVSYYPVRSAGGELLGIGVIVQDITERKQAEQMRAELLASAQAAREAEQIARANAEEAVHLRDDFLAIAAHELRTPLTSLLMQAQILYRRLNAADGLSDQNQRSLEVIISQAQRLNGLIGDILDGARIETGQLIIRRATLDLGELVRQATEELLPSLTRHQLSSIIEGDPLMIDGDAVRLDQVLQNLLSNALKYSPNGGKIELRAARRGNYAAVSISDEGIGIPPEALPRLFERFYRATDRNTQEVSGAGVGLYVVKEIVAQHGGWVTVESEPGQGSTFIVTLPLQGMSGG
jgi:signal transduction histidine kinase